MNIDLLTYGEMKKIAALFTGCQPPNQDNERLAGQGAFVIAVLQRGWVAIGKYAQVGRICTLYDAAIIRRWGTEKGLGELAEKGPRPKTVMDKCPPIQFHCREAVFIMECVADAWK